jgi:hypothetical protein
VEERPGPDLDDVREALREHDQRAEDEPPRRREDDEDEETAGGDDAA